jgi:hypothetical protein
MRVLVLMLLLSTAARGDEETRYGWSVGAGVGTALVSLAAGGALLATACSDSSNPNCEAAPQRRAGIHVMATGLALAPIFSHLIAHEYRRAIWFGIAPVVLGVLSMGLLEGSRPDDLLDSGAAGPRIVFGAALALELVASAIGLADSLMAGERIRAKKAVPVTLAPIVGPHRYGLGLGGWF